MERYTCKRTAWVALVVAAVLVVCFAQVCLAYNPGDPEFRGFWVDAWGAGFLNQSQVNTLLGTVGTSTKGQIRDANCNAVVVQVRRNCDACYPSSMGEPSFTGGFNALQAIINAAHDTTGGKQRIEVHCWMVTFRTSGGTVYGLHNGTPTGSLTNLDNYWPTRTSGGAETGDYAFDPGHPGAENYIANVAMDLVSNFDIDGIHYDYIRFTANDQGYNPTSVARYNARYGLSGQPANVAGAHGSGDPTDQWDQWRRDQISALVRQVYARVQATKPWVKQSGSFVTWNPSPASSTRASFRATRPYYDVYSDWDAWMQEGIVDAAIPMTYYNYASLPSDWTKWINFEKDRKFNRHMYIGPGIYLNSLANAILEIQQTRTASPAGNYAQGFCGYSYRTPYSGGTWDGFSPSLLSDVTGDLPGGGPVNIPAMPWKATPTMGHISGRVTYAAGGAWADGALVSITGPASRTQYCDGTGFYAFIDLPTGTYQMTVSKTGYTSLQRSVTVAIGSVTGNMYVNNFQLGSGIAITNVQATNITNNAATITWDTSPAGDSQVEYGLTASYGTTTPLNGAYVTSHSVALTGLTPKSPYHFKVHSGNADGPGESGDYTFTTAGPPVISNVHVVSVGGTTATIAWNTDVASDSTVNYGLTTGYGSQGASATQVTSHSIPLSGLAPNTTYHYQCVSANVWGPATTTDFTFTTSDMRPVITNVQVTSITAGSAVITWTTDVAADSTVDYGMTTSYGSQQSNASLVTSHSITLNSLTAKTTYHFKVTSANSYGPTSSVDYSFATHGPPVISNVQATVTATTATITWTTDETADSTVNYGAATSYGSQQTNASQVTSHSIALSGLTASTPYHYQCVSVNPYGSDTSTDYTFTTASIPVEIIVDNTDPGWASTGGSSWSVGSNASVPKIGTNYLYATGDSGTRKCTWTPNLSADGLYDVYAFYQKGTNRNSSATYKVYYDGSSLSSVQNQHSDVANQGDWFLLGQNLPFKAGTAGYVELSSQSSDTAYVSSDAAKWVFKSAGDITPPTISIGAPSAALTRTGPITYTINYGGADTVTLAAGNITLNKTGAADGAVAVSGTGNTTRTVTISSITGDGTLGISIAAGTASDLATNTAPAAGPSATFNVDNSVPTISIGAPSAAQTSTDPITYTITYGGADSISLAAGNVTLNKTGSADGTVGISGTGNTSRTVTISSLSGSGTLGISIAAGTASDLASNPAPAVGPSATFTVDNSPPVMSSVTDETYTTSTTALLATWSGSDPESGIERYEYAVGTDPDTATDNIAGWTDAGTTTSATITGLTLVVGQTYYISVRATDGLGLTSEPLSSPGVTVAYPVASVREGKTLEDGKPVALPATLVVSGKFPTSFYLEDSNRLSGVRVEYTSSLVADQTARVFGVLGVNGDGERAILSPKVIPGSMGTAIRPLFVIGKSVGGSDLVVSGVTTPGVTNAMGLNNIGLLVRIAGKVTKGVSDGFYLDDGVGATDETGYAGVKIWTGASGVTYENKWAMVTGVVSCRKPGAIVPQILAVNVAAL